jgi:hypothetical protein
MIDHFLITRFNLKKNDWTHDKNSKQVLDEDWHERRIKIFKDYCFPSVINQTTKKIKWLIFFEKSSYDLVSHLIFKLKKHNFIEPQFVEGYEEFQLLLPEIIRNYRNKNNYKVLTTRLDNDDALHKDFALRLQQAAVREIHHSLPCLLYFPFGLFLEIGRKPRLGGLLYKNNQFLSLLEEYETVIKTIYGEEHHKWNQLQKFTVNNDFFWLQISHDDNQVNRFKGWLISKAYLKPFHIVRTKFSSLYFFQVLLSKMKREYISLPGRYYLKAKFKKFRSIFNLN